MRLPQTPRMSMTAGGRTPTTDIRKRMDDVYNEMEQSARNGRIRMPLKFVNFHQTDVMYQFTRAAVGYALSYVKAKTLEKENAERAGAEELAKFHASQLQNQFHHDELSPECQREQQQREREACRQRLRQALESQASCASLLAETYARLVLHCSNFEHHKEDERFFESVYFFICSVVKIGLASDHWVAVEEELGFVFRGAQFSATIKLHTSAKAQREQAAAAAAAAAAAGDAANTAAKKIQNLSAAGASTKDTVSVRGDASLFVLPTAPATRCCYFSASLPVGKIVSELDAVKLRATRNIEISQSIRDRIRATREDEHQRRLVDALTSPRVGVRLDALQRKPPPPATATTSTPSATAATSSAQTPQQPRRRPHHAGSGSPRLSMKATYTSRSPAVNHLLPGTEDRVRLALEEYERGFQRALLEHRQALQRQRRLDASTTRSDLCSCASSVSTQLTPTKPPPR